MYHNYSYYPPSNIAPDLIPYSTNSQKSEHSEFDNPENFQQNLDSSLRGRCQPRLVEVNLHEEANARWEKKSKLHIQDQVIKGVAVAALIALGFSLFLGSPFVPCLFPLGLAALAIIIPGMILGAATFIAGGVWGAFSFRDESKPNYHNRDEANKISLKLKNAKLEHVDDLNISKLKRYGFVEKEVATRLREFRKQFHEDNKIIQVEETQQVLRRNGDVYKLRKYWKAKQRQEGLKAEWATFQREVLAHHLPCLTVKA
jgi:hypothetical protein